MEILEFGQWTQSSFTRLNQQCPAHVEVGCSLWAVYSQGAKEQR